MRCTRSATRSPMSWSPCCSRRPGTSYHCSVSHPRWTNASRAGVSSVTMRARVSITALVACAARSAHVSCRVTPYRLRRARRSGRSCVASPSRCHVPKVTGGCSRATSIIMCSRAVHSAHSASSPRRWRRGSASHDMRTLSGSACVRAVMERLILGTAGHIDHGKTTLVRALTGTDTDRLPEEKRRGITVDIGFAALDLPDGTHFGVVDVPGHEAFVRNMLAGASGVDVALLVVAADEGVMPQTREHLAILALLDVRALVVALTKTDLVDAEWLELATEDVGTLLEATPWPDAPIIPVAGTTGAGLDELRDALAASAHGSRERRRDDQIRMPNDRVFTVHGTGTIVTGTAWSGTVQRDVHLRLLPADRNVRVRGVQSHGTASEIAGAGERTALALAGLERSDVARGDVLVQGDAWRAADILTVLLTLLPDAPRALEPGDRVRAHLGTDEAMARVTLMGNPRIAPGETLWAQLRLERALVTRARDRVVVRSDSPVVTIGGGVVAEPGAPRRGRLADDDAGRLRDVITGAAEAAIMACAGLHPWQGAERAALPITTGLPPRDVEAALPAMTDVAVSTTRVFTRAAVLDDAARI